MPKTRDMAGFLQFNTYLGAIPGSNKIKTAKKGVKGGTT